MSDHDPGNAGGSVIIPRSPVRPTQNWYVCETCGLKFESLERRDAHLETHMSAQPTLRVKGFEVPTNYVVSNETALQSLLPFDATRVEVSGMACDAGALGGRLKLLNGLGESEVVLVGRREHIRSSYRVR